MYVLVRWMLPPLGLVLAVMTLASRGEDKPKATPPAAPADPIKPFLTKHCVRCHNPDKMTSGVRVDHLTGTMEDAYLKLWEGVLRQIVDGSMPPEEEPQPTNDERKRIIEMIRQGIDQARSRPVPKNGSIRRLTVAQYRNTLRELLGLEDNIGEILPPDAVSKDGFVNNQTTLQMSPVLLESYLELAETALERTLVDPASKPTIQNFRVDLGTGVNPNPIKDRLILGANSHLIPSSDFTVTELKPTKPFAYTPFSMKTKFRFIEGYQGNDTVRGWREYDSIYHAVFACMRGSDGYPKGRAYSTVPQGLLLRPAIPSSEIFGVESTYGPRANFKIALRELPSTGRFRITVNAAKYNDGLLLDPGTPTAQGPGSIEVNLGQGNASATIPTAGIYQVDIPTTTPTSKLPKPDNSKLSDGLVGYWPMDGSAASKPEQKQLLGQLAGDARFVDSPFGQAVSLDGYGDAGWSPVTSP